MIAAIAVALALISGAENPTRDLAIPSPAACQLAKRENISNRKTYVIEGSYDLDWEWGAFLKVSDCDLPISSTLDGAAAARTAAYHQTFAAKCGMDFRNDHLAGEFTGHFIKRKSRLHGTLVTTEVFVITEIRSEDEDSSTITCPK